MSVGIRTWPAITVSLAGTAVQLFPFTPSGIGTTPHHASAVRVESDRRNTGILYVGDANVSATQYTTALLRGDSISIEGSAVDVSRIWVTADTNNTIAQVSVLS